MSTAPLRVGCVGAGYFSQFHYDAWARMADADCVGAADHDLAAAKATGVPAFASARALIEATRPDLLDIILPPIAHAETIRCALEMGIKWIICQKPFCTSLAEAETIVADAQAAGATVIVHENFRFMPWYRVIAAELAQGTIGQVMQATFRLRPGDGQGPRAYLDRQPYFQQMPEFLIHETGVHWIDTFRFLFGSPQAVYADLRRLNPAIAGEDAGVVLFDHPGGVRAIFDGNRHLDHRADNLRRTMGEALIEGTEGTLTLYGNGAVDRRAFGKQTVETILPPDTHQGFGGDCVYHLQSHVVAGIRSGSEIENLAQDYCEVIRIRDAIYQSAQSGRKLTL